MKTTLSFAVLILIYVSGCVSKGYIPEPSYDTKDPKITRLMFFLGKSRKSSLFKKFMNKYRLIQKKFGQEGKYYPRDYAYTYWYKKDKIVKLVIAVHRPVARKGFGIYTGALPYGLYRRDTHQTVMNKLGKPDSSILDKSILVYNKKHLQITFIDNILSTVTITAE